MDKAKIRLSPEEAELVANADWILTKNGILQKVNYMLGELQSVQQEFLQSYLKKLPGEVIMTSPKISKGENYKGLPWLVLDYPRYFDKDDQFAIRCLFWWGNFFSITLQLSGHYKKIYEKKIGDSFTQLKEEGFSICISDDKWEHHFEAGNYSPLKEINMDTFRKHLNDKEFIKLAKMYPLAQWDEAGDLLLASFAAMIKWLAD
ncbi:MAG TPA: hypothetical protein VIZ28_18040 [Chitinophagaceae bacterium]